MNYWVTADADLALDSVGVREQGIIVDAYDWRQWRHSSLYPSNTQLYKMLDQSLSEINYSHHHWRNMRNGLIVVCSPGEHLAQ